MSSIIYDPFVVNSLPRLPPKTDVFKSCVSSQIKDANSNSFDVAISGSYLATFITRPSPKMIWSYALSPQTIVTSMDSFDFEEISDNQKFQHNHQVTDGKIFAVGINERKANKLRFISYGTEEKKSSSLDDENQSSSLSTVNEEDKQSNEMEHIKEVKDRSINVDDKIAGLKFSKNSKYVYSVSSNGTISVYKFSVDSGDDENPIFKRKAESSRNKASVIFHQFIKPEELKVNSRNDKIDYLLITAEKTESQSSIDVSVFSINDDEILEISKSTIDSLNDVNNIHITYDISGKLIILENEPKLTIKAYDLPFVNNGHRIEIGGVFKHERKDSPTSVACASSNRILVTKGSTVALIDIQYEALLSSLDLYSRSKDTDNLKPPRDAVLLNVPSVNGNTLKSKKTFALLILKNTKENYSQIQHVSIDVGLGKLRDALVSLPSVDDSQSDQFTSFTSYFTKQDQQHSGVNKSEAEKLNSQINQSNDELSEVYSKLVEIKNSGDVRLLENSIVSYLKNKPFGELFEDGEFKAYEYEKDRFVDPRFFTQLTLLLFEYDIKTDTITLDVSNEDSIPEYGLTYILTHPLFPIKYSHGLLRLLEPLPRLQRQAIVTCANIPCGDFIMELSSCENDEIFKDIMTRLNDEFSGEEITKETMKIMRQQSHVGKKDSFNLDRIINKIIKLNFGFEVLNSFIDSNGLILSLHYSNDDHQLSKLIEQTQLKVDSLIEDTQLLTLVNQCLTNAEASKQGKASKSSKKYKRKDKKKSEAHENGEQSIEVGLSKLDMILKVGTESQGSKKKTRSSTYTIDRLVI